MANMPIPGCGTDPGPETDTPTLPLVRPSPEIRKVLKVCNLSRF